MSMDVKRWFILVGQIIVALAVGFPYMLSIIAGPLNVEKGWAIGTLMLVFTISMWLSSPAYWVFGKLQEKFGNRKLIIVGGIVYGASVSLSVLMPNVWGFIIVGGGVSSFCMFGIFVAQLANVGALFPDKRGLATGIYYGAQSFLFSASCIPLATIIEKMNVVPAIILIGIIFGVVTVIIGIFAVDPPEGYVPKGMQPGEGEEEMPMILDGPECNWIELLKSPAFYLLLIVLAGLMIGGMGFSSNVSLMAQSALGIDETKGAFFSTVFFLGSGFGGIVSGTLTDKIGGSKALCALCALSLVFVAIYLTVATGSYAVFAIVVFVVGLGYGGMGAAMSVITMNTWGQKHFGVNMGFVGIAGMISSVIGPVAAGVADVRSALILILVVNIVGVIAAIALDKAMKAHFAKWEARKTEVA